MSDDICCRCHAPFNDDNMGIIGAEYHDDPLTCIDNLSDSYYECKRLKADLAQMQRRVEELEGAPGALREIAERLIVRSLAQDHLDATALRMIAGDIEKAISELRESNNHGN